MSMLDRARAAGLLGDGKPILGTYGGATMDELRACRDAGFNLVLAGADAVDPDTDRGRFAEENGIRVLYHLTRHVYNRPITGAWIDAKQTTIPLLRHDLELRGPGVVQIDDELVRFTDCTATAFLGCERGVEGTEPVPHEEAVITFDPVACRAEVERVKDSPNLWGYYVLDDSPGNCLAALRAQYRIIKLVVDLPVGAGYGSVGSFCNFGPGVCDFAMLYEYPVRHDNYYPWRTSRRVQWMLMAARERVPGVPFVAVYQAFGDDDYWKTPTKRQLRTHVEDFVREGAVGLTAFISTFGSGYGWADVSELRDELTAIHTELRDTGDLQVSSEPDEIASTRFQPAGSSVAAEIPGLVPAWHVIGPFDPGETTLEMEFPPEREIDMDTVYDGKGGPIRWVARPSTAGMCPAIEIHDRKYMAPSISYATCVVESPAAQEVQIGVAAADAVVVWHEGNEVYRCEYGHFGDEVWEVWHRETATVSLPSGSSRFLVKLYNRRGPGGFLVRFLDSHGSPLDGLSFTPGA